MPGVEKFITKPVEVEAYHWDGTVGQLHYIIGWIISNGGTAWAKSGYAVQGPDLIQIETPEGQPMAYPGNWIVRDSHGDFRPVKSDVFEDLYTPDTIEETN